MRHVPPPLLPHLALFALAEDAILKAAITAPKTIAAAITPATASTAVQLMEAFSIEIGAKLVELLLADQKIAKVKDVALDIVEKKAAAKRTTNTATEPARSDRRSNASLPNMTNSKLFALLASPMPAARALIDKLCAESAAIKAAVEGSTEDDADALDADDGAGGGGQHTQLRQPGRAVRHHRTVQQPS